MISQRISHISTKEPYMSTKRALHILQRALQNSPTVLQTGIISRKESPTYLRMSSIYQSKSPGHMQRALKKSPHVKQIGLTSRKENTSLHTSSIYRSKSPTKEPYCTTNRPNISQRKHISTHELNVHMIRARYFHTQALHIRKQVLHIHKRALYTCKRAVHLRKRAPNIYKRFFHIRNARPLISCTRDHSTAYPQKSPAYLRESSKISAKELYSTHPQKKPYKSAKEPCISIKEP